jgi:hypothetical protein
MSIFNPPGMPPLKDRYWWLKLMLKILLAIVLVFVILIGIFLGTCMYIDMRR